MKTLRLIPLLLMLALLSCNKVPGEIIKGEWRYRLMVNGVRAGSAVITSGEKDGMLIKRTAMSIKLGTIKNSSVQTVTETKDFRPVRLEIMNTLEDTSSGNRHLIAKVAEFSDDTVTLDSDGTKAVYKIPGPFIIEGEFFTDSLIKGGFKEGMEVRARLYEPTVAADKTILVIINVAGRKKNNSRGQRTLPYPHTHAF